MPTTWGALWNAIEPLFFVLLGPVLLVTAVRGLFKGVAYSKVGRVYRVENPVLFWLSLGTYFLLGAVGTAVGIALVGSKL